MTKDRLLFKHMCHEVACLSTVGSKLRFERSAAFRWKSFIMATTSRFTTFYTCSPIEGTMRVRTSFSQSACLCACLHNCRRCWASMTSVKHRKASKQVEHNSGGRQASLLRLIFFYIALAFFILFGCAYFLTMQHAYLGGKWTMKLLRAQPRHVLVDLGWEHDINGVKKGKTAILSIQCPKRISSRIAPYFCSFILLFFVCFLFFFFSRLDPCHKRTFC